MTAAAQLERIVSLVADLSRTAGDAENGRSLAELAGRYGVSPGQIAGDIQTLTTLCDHAEAEWLLSLSAWQQDDRVSVTSLGPFRRPILLSPDERLALQVALALDPEGAALAARLAAAGQVDEAGLAPAPRAPRSPGDFPGLFVDAANARRCVEVLYAGEGDDAGRQSVIEPHELLGYRGHTYVHAWDRDGRGWRFFRMDRFLDALPAEATFERRDDFEPVTGRTDLFRAPASAVETVRVRYSPQVARWIRERYPRCEDDGNGGVVVTFLVTSVEWLVRRVLEHGAEAEVLGPPAYREAVRRAVA
jgi:predicted DNA-binding transcriptional regulator YafY